MEYNTRLSVVLCLCLVTVVVLGDNGPEPEDSFQQNCRKCKSGYFAIIKCNDKHDTICAPCPEDSFTSSLNLLDQCTTCFTCGDGYFVMKPCTRHDDTVCESCLSVKYSHLSSYQKRCLDVVVPDRTLLLPEPEPKETLVLPEGEGSADGSEDISLGSEFQAPVLDNTDDIINASEIIKFDEDEGSGDEVELNIGAQEEPDTETDLTVILSPVNKTKSDETEQKITLPSQPTTTQNTARTGDAGSADFVPMTTGVSKTTAKSTEPIFFHVTAKPEVPTVTPEGSIHIGEGLSVKPEVDIPSTNGADSNDKNYVLYTAAPRHRDRENRVHHHHVQNSLDKPVPTAEQKVGAQSSSHNHEEDTSKVTVGVMVAVAVSAAFVFFIFGFIVSVRCRRSRESSFQVMKKVDKNGSWNSGSPVPINIEYRDEERDGIYDDIDKDTTRHPSGKPIKQEYITPRQVEDLYAVPDKKKKSKDPEPRVDHIDRIKFIDETTDDEFGTKDEEILGLLRKGRDGVTHDHNGSIPRLDDSDSGADVGPSDTPPVEVNNQQGETIAQDPNVIIEEDEENEDESSPMLTNDSQDSTLPQDVDESVKD